MVDFKVVLSDPETGKSYKVDATGGAAGSLIGKKVGDEVGGEALGLSGYTIAITGGTDNTGIPARRDLPGVSRRRLLLSEGTGFKPHYDGERRRKSIRGNEITQDFVQVNAKVVKYGEKDLKSIFEPEPEATEGSEE
jgi:small subunit ribosomal protein S6e